MPRKTFPSAPNHTQPQLPILVVLQPVSGPQRSKTGSKTARSPIMMVLLKPSVIELSFRATLRLKIPSARACDAEDSDPAGRG